jgi:hypothetical protein
LHNKGDGADRKSEAVFVKCRANLLSIWSAAHPKTLSELGDSMGILNSVSTEVTKWLLKKVDTVLKRPSSSYRDKVFLIYHGLCHISDYLEENSQTIIKFLLNNGHTLDSYKEYKQFSLPSYTTYIPDYGDAILSLASDIRLCLSVFDEVGKKMFLESEYDKEFWINNIKYLKALEQCLDKSWAAIRTDEGRKDQVGARMTIENLKKQFESTDPLYSIIKGLKDYINMIWPP